MLADAEDWAEQKALYNSFLCANGELVVAENRRLAEDKALCLLILWGEMAGFGKEVETVV